MVTESPTPASGDTWGDGGRWGFGVDVLNTETEPRGGQGDGGGRGAAFLPQRCCLVPPSRWSRAQSIPGLGSEGDWNAAAMMT